ncbi:hypothetical protein C8J56DRAFT_884717 [Mycena floridula]|nr:hypothetical protein C8J56DRAFT_884717 [Mycena floridula]
MPFDCLRASGRRYGGVELDFLQRASVTAFISLPDVEGYHQHCGAGEQYSFRRTIAFRKSKDNPCEWLPSFITVQEVDLFVPLQQHAKHAANLAQERTRATKVQQSIIENLVGKPLLILLQFSSSFQIVSDESFDKGTRMRVRVSRFRSRKLEGPIGSNNIIKGKSLDIIVEKVQVELRLQVFLGKPGVQMSLQEFCNKYGLSQTIFDMLMKRGYEKARTLCYLTEQELEEMGFMPGQQAELTDAIKQWSDAANT